MSCVVGSKGFSEEKGQNLTIGGDLRYRHELIDMEGKDMRTRQRIRTRLNLQTKVHDDVKIGVQLASGSGDPVSTNQTLTNGFSGKQINIDEAFFEWQPRSFHGFAMVGGKVKNPLFIPGNTELLWDNDLKPEGLSLGYSGTRGPVTLFTHASYFWVEERKADKDAILLEGQAGVNYTSSIAQVIFGCGYFDYQNAKNYPPTYNPKDGLGNSVDSKGNYRYDYKDLEFFGELNPVGLAGNVSIFFDFVSNIAKNVDKNQAWLAGFVIGKCKKPGSFDFRYSFRYLEKDALVGAFTDSDFNDGRTDGKGHEINIDYQIASKINTGITYYFNQQGIDNSKDYQRLMVDVNFKL
jgi:hypothetical protein